MANKIKEQPQPASKNKKKRKKNRKKQKKRQKSNREKMSLRAYKDMSAKYKLETWEYSPVSTIEWSTPPQPT